MSKDNVAQLKIKQQPAENSGMLRKAYQKPVLEELGDLRAVTLAGSVYSVTDTGPIAPGWNFE